MTEGRRGATQLVRALGLWDCVLYVAGSMIGSGIFLSAGIVIRKAAFPSWIVAVWIVGAIHSVAAGLTYAELGARRPEAGGPYVYLSETFGKLWGFLYMWAMVFVVMPGSVAALSTAFAEYLGAFVPALGTQVSAFSAMGLPVSQGQLVAIATAFALSAWNVLGIKEGGRLNGVLTVVKIGSVIALVVFGLTAAKAVRPSFAFPPMSAPLAVSIGGALAGVLWAYDGWINLSTLGGEVKNPKRDIPGGLLLGVLVVALLYLGANAVYLGAASVETLGASPRAAETAVRTLFGDGAARWLTLAVVVSVLGSLAANVIPGPRISWAAAKDGQLPAPFALLHPKYATPAFGLAFQAVLGAALTVSGKFDELVATVSFAATFFYALGGAALFVYRRRQPDAPWKTPGYPWIPAFYVATSLVFTLAIALDSPKDASRGLLLLGAGVAVYAWEARKTIGRPAGP